MMKTIFMLLTLVSLTSCLEETPERKAKKMIKEYLKDNLNDYSSYSSLSFSTLDTLFNQWTLPEELRSEVGRLTECAEKINSSGYKNITIDSDANSYLKDFDILLSEQNRKKGEPEYIKRVEERHKLWLEFKQHQDIIKKSKQSFKRHPIGWALIHTYRTKNQYDATVLIKNQFCFDKEMTQITRVDLLKAD